MAKTFFAELVRHEDWSRAPASAKYPFAALVLVSVLTAATTKQIGWPGPLWRDALAILLGISASAIVRTSLSRGPRRTDAEPGTGSPRPTHTPVHHPEETMRSRDMAHHGEHHRHELLASVLSLTSSREELEALLAHVRRVQHDAIALASAAGVPRQDLTDLTGLSAEGITEIINATDLTDLHPSVIQDASWVIADQPLDVLDSVVKARLRTEDDDPAAQARHRRRTAIVYGEAEAARRYGSEQPS
ncbi:hypothetical protein ACI2IX_19885 [Leifsonia aquatica]|uniref:hypothetical protein n=1 Tax=Leifsonia aquatica TaxID=144185 RepID=UPI00385112E2